MCYFYLLDPVNIVSNVETHNHTRTTQWRTEILDTDTEKRMGRTGHARVGVVSLTEVCKPVHAIAL